MRATLLTLLAVLALAAVAPTTAAGAEPGQADLPAECETWVGDNAAVACDPVEQLRGTIAFPGAELETVEDEGELAVAQVGGSREPLLPGERLTLSVTTPSATARLFVRVAGTSPDTRRVVVLDRLVDGMAVAVNDNLEVTVTRGSEVVTLPPPPQHVAPPPAQSPGELAARVVHGVNTFFVAGQPGFQEVCDTIDPAARPYFDLAFGDPEQLGCPGLLYLFTVGDENVPRATASSATLVSVRATGAAEALLTADVVYRYIPNSTGDRRRIARRARALVRRVADGSWRLADPRSFLGLSLTEGPDTTAPTLAKLRGRARNLRAAARRARREADALDRRRRAAMHPVGGPASCAPGTVTRVADAQGDAVVDGSDERTRLPALGATVDLLGASLVTRRGGPPCLTLDFAQPVDLNRPLDIELVALPPELSRVLTRTATVHIEAGQVSANDGDSDDIRFFRGARAASRGNRLVVRLAPAQWTGAIKRTRFSWNVRAVRDHPYAISIEDSTRNTRHGRSR
jgi:hypothetical protein